MRALATTLVGLLVASVLTGCRSDESRPPSTELTAAATVPQGGAVTSVPELTDDLSVVVVTGVRVMGTGCRQTSPHDACTVDGSRTFTWVGARHRATLTSARMRLEPGHGSWLVTLRFARADRALVEGVATGAAGMGGYALLLDGRTGNALEATAPQTVEHGRIRLPDLAKPVAWDVVSSFVTAATQR